MSFAPVGLDGVATAIGWWYDAALVTGHRVGDDGVERPLLARVDLAGRVTYADLPGRGRVLSAWFNGEPEVDLTLVGPSGARYLHGTPDDGFTEDADAFFVRGAQAVWTVCGDEDPVYVTEWERGRLTVSDPVEANEPFPDSLGLFRVGPRSELLVGQDATAAYVAGILRRGDERSPRLSLWAHDPWGSRDRPAGWQRVDLAIDPDGITAMRSGALGITVSGHHHARPCVLTGTGAALDVPDVPLDAAHPFVLDVDLDPSRPGGSLVLQSAAEGPQAWTRTDDGWVPAPLPAGRLHTAARPTTTGELWVVVDGHVWRET